MLGSTDKYGFLLEVEALEGLQESAGVFGKRWLLEAPLANPYQGGYNFFVRGWRPVWMDQEQEGPNDLEGLS